MLAAIVGITAAPPAAYGQAGYITFNQVDQTALYETFEVNVRALNFRPAPTLGQAPISVVQKGEFLLKTGETFNKDEGITWMKATRADGLEGWVSGRYVSSVKDAIGRIEGAAAFLVGLNPTAAPVVAAADDIKAGFIYPGPVGDAGWAFSHDAGRQALEQLPFVSGTSFIESVPEDPELVVAALEDLVAEGNNLIFGASYGYMDPMMEVAKRHPNVVFMHNSGFKTQPNAGTYFGRIYQARYLSGIVAGAMTESNVIGYVAAFPIPEVIRGINAFTLGAQSVNPEVQVKVDWTNTWYGPGIEQETAEGLLDQSADVITIHQDSPAAILAASRRGKYAIGYHSDMRAFAPDATLTSVVWNWSGLYQQVASDMAEGAWKPDQIWSGLDKGVVDLAPISDKVPWSVRSLVEQRRQAVIDKKIRIFEGPIRDAEGEIRVPSGKVLSDADLLTMDYYVLGVEGGVAPTFSTVTDDDEAS
ncbi:MAG: BMP family ABC transporter substrate-binding protein [Alphaproteobacteria bacterium]|nr:BMP family ABC transporter substrate-binding protein [Alphaproteobacteria bacterium]